MIINKYNKHRKQYEKHQQTIKSFDILYRESLQDNVIDENEHENFYNSFIKYVDENKIEFFLKI